MSRRAMMGAVGVAALLVGCSESSDVATGPRYAVNAPTTSSCNITQTKADARAYFPNGVQTTVQAMIKTLGDQYTAGQYVIATNIGFDLMKYVADEHRAKVAANATDLLATYGSNFTKDLIGCMKTLSPTPPATVDFTPALGAQGGYEVRGGISNAGLNDVDTPVSAVGLKSAIAAPSVGFAAWVGTRVLFYGAPIPNANAVLTEQTISNLGYNWSTIPERHSFTGTQGGLFGVCLKQELNHDRDLIQTYHLDDHGNPVRAVLLSQPTSDLETAGFLDCGTPLTIASHGLLPRLMQLAVGFVSPQPAFAAALGGGTGGTLNGLSDLGVVDAGQVNLTMSFVKDATISTNIVDTVTARGNGGSALPGVWVTLLISGNNGSYTPITDSTQTDGFGRAIFAKNINKAGGYTLEATSSFPGYSQASVFSNLFHIKQ